MEYPWGDYAVIVDAESGRRREITAGDSSNALYYELQDMEAAVKTGDTSMIHLQKSCDVMNIMTKLRKDRGLMYPGEMY